MNILLYFTIFHQRMCLHLFIRRHAGVMSRDVNLHRPGAVTAPCFAA